MNQLSCWPRAVPEPRGRRLRNPNDVARLFGVCLRETWLLTGDYALGVDTLRELWFVRTRQNEARLAVRRRHDRAKQLARCW